MRKLPVRRSKPSTFLRPLAAASICAALASCAPRVPISDRVLSANKAALQGYSDNPDCSVSIRFDTNSSQLDRHASALIRLFAKRAHRDRQTVVVVPYLSQEEGSSGGSIKLVNARAESVVDKLKQSGLPPERILAHSIGDLVVSEPIAGLGQWGCPR